MLLSSVSKSPPRSKSNMPLQTQSREVSQICLVRKYSPYSKHMVSSLRFTRMFYKGYISQTMSHKEKCQISPSCPFDMIPSRHMICIKMTQFWNRWNVISTVLTSFIKSRWLRAQWEPPPLKEQMVRRSVLTSFIKVDG